MSTDDPIVRQVDAAAAVMGLAIPEAHRDAVIAYVRLAAGLAAQVNAFPLPPEQDPAPLYWPEPRESDR